jgi:hypothetical protein
MPGCGGSAELDLDQQVVDGYRTRDDAQAAAQDHIRALAAARSSELCPGTCDGEISRCKAIVLDDDLAGAVRTFMHRDDDGDPSFGWLIGGTITVHCACVQKLRPGKPVMPAAARVAETAAPTQTGRPRRAARQRPPARQQAQDKPT